MKASSQEYIPAHLSRSLSPSAPKDAVPFQAADTCPPPPARMQMWPFNFVTQEKNTRSAHNLLMQAGELPRAASRTLRAWLAWDASSMSGARSALLSGPPHVGGSRSPPSSHCGRPARPPGQRTPCSVFKDEGDPTGRAVSPLSRLSGLKCPDGH